MVKSSSTSTTSNCRKSWRLPLRDEELPKDAQEANWFSAPSALRVYGQYLNLDSNHNGMLTKNELAEVQFGQVGNTTCCPRTASRSGSVAIWLALQGACAKGFVKVELSPHPLEGENRVDDFDPTSLDDVALQFGFIERNLQRLLLKPPVIQCSHRRQSGTVNKRKNRLRSHKYYERRGDLMSVLVGRFHQHKNITSI
ncbi:unnamed protein product [Nesidiocoris tenuis]|uniref:EF-hand domain-containing protein n=1 Tax=Nesidiocoris tenuis TaxID=355587 RepID=A0A6H5G103_9HEMI|nr:unnamed protein product [Nesidiocoris tenuis]